MPGPHSLRLRNLHMLALRYSKPTPTFRAIGYRYSLSGNRASDIIFTTYLSLWKAHHPIPPYPSLPHSTSPPHRTHDCPTCLAIRCQRHHHWNPIDSPTCIICGVTHTHRFVSSL